MNSLSLPVRRFVAIGILGILLLLAWDLVIDPAVSYWSNATGDQSRSQRLLAAYQATIDERPKWEAMLQQLQNPPYSTFFTEVEDQDIAGARLQQKVKQLTEASHGQIRTIQVLPPGSDQGLKRVGVRVNFTIPVMDLKELFEKYDEDRPYIFLDNLVITAPENPSAPETKPAQLSVNCNLYAYLRP